MTKQQYEAGNILRLCFDAVSLLDEECQHAVFGQNDTFVVLDVTYRISSTQTKLLSVKTGRVYTTLFTRIFDVIAA